MTSAQEWTAVLMILLIVGLVVSMVYLMLSKDVHKWQYWGAAFSGFFLVSALILVIIYPRAQEQQPSPQEKYKILLHQARENPVCDTEREVCTRQAVELKRENDILLRGDLQELEQRLRDEPNNQTLIASIKLKKETLVNDIQKIDNCKTAKATNRCVEHILDQCETMIRQKSDPVLQNQFQDFRATKDPSEVLNLCNSIANTK